MTVTNIESTTWLDRFPTEIIFETFSYLSSNDIIYTFFFFSRRFNTLLLQNQCYLTHLELPTTNSSLWQNILSAMGSQIESLNISMIDFSFSLSLFPNLKSLIVSSPYCLINKQLKLILESNQFNNLHSLKIKQNEIFFNLLHNKYFTDENDILKKVFNNQNSLRTFQYSAVIQSSRKMPIYGLEKNFNLYSLTLVLTDLHDIYSLIENTPNLNYLNITTQPFYLDHSNVIKKGNIKLKQFYLKLVQEISTVYGPFLKRMRFDEIMNRIKHLSLSSLTCLSLEFIDVLIENANNFPINSIKLQQFLETMPELKQFHLYVTLNDCGSNLKTILETFNDQFWFDHNWSFGTHGRYFYTLPFHFDHLDLDGLLENLDDVKSNNPEIRKTNPRLWYHVKSIDLHFQSKYDLNFVKEKTESDNVTTVRSACRSFEKIKDLLIYALPNVKHLMSTAGHFPSKESELVSILNERIEQLYVDETLGKLEKLAERNDVYFSNIQHIHFGLNDYDDMFGRLAYVVMETLKNFQKLKTLTLYRSHSLSKNMSFTSTTLNKLIGYLNLNEILKNYHMKPFEGYLFFSKKTFET